MDNEGRIAFGLFFIFFIIFIILALIIRKTNKRSDYDERQLAVRGKAYRAAYLVFLVLILFNGLFYVFTGKSLADPCVTSVFSMCVSIIVFAFKCMANDAYIGVSTNARKYVVLLIIIGVLNVFNAVIYFKEEIISFTNGEYLFDISTSFMVGITFILVAAGIMWRINKENDGDEK